MRRLVHRVSTAGESGATLIDLLIVLAALSVMMGAVYGVYTAGTKVYRKASQLSDRQEQARTALNFMLRDIREMGFDPQGAMSALSLTTPLLTADKGTMEFVRGFSDGVTNLYSYKVKYTYSKTGNALCSLGCISRQVAAWNPASKNFNSYGSATAIATTVGELAFTYYDGGKRIVIQITMAADPANPQQVVLSSNVRPRNL